MKHIILLYWLTAIISGTAAISVGLFLYRNTRNNILKCFLLLFISLFPLVILLGIYYYCVINDVSPGDGYGWLNRFTALFTAFVPYTTVRFRNAFEDVPNHALITRITLFISIALAVQYIIGCIAAPGLAMLFLRPVFIALVLAIIYAAGSGVVLTVLRRNQPKTANRFHDRIGIAVSFISLASLPLFIAVDFWFYTIAGIESTHGLGILPGFFILISISFLVLITGRKETVLFPAAVVTDAFRTRFKLTDRETQIIAFLVNGERYHAIADMLGISLVTVKTHVGNVYQKTGVRSKVDLLKILSHTKV
ncbi:MAG: helix-turn-helix transcriptional regulator [Spirochaetes bacterium]|nr:helix-turn-helix transcriptional regulator [Spirochaetota bacterium]